MKFNGGVPEKEYFKGKFWVSSFYSVKYGNNTLESVKYAYENLIPKHLLPFADDPGGNEYCMDLSNENYGKIYFLDWDEPDDLVFYQFH